MCGWGRDTPFIVVSHSRAFFVDVCVNRERESLGPRAGYAVLPTSLPLSLRHHAWSVVKDRIGCRQRGGKSIIHCAGNVSKASISSQEKKKRALSVKALQHTRANVIIKGRRVWLLHWIVLVFRMLNNGRTTQSQRLSCYVTPVFCSPQPENKHSYIWPKMVDTPCTVGKEKRIPSYVRALHWFNWCKPLFKLMIKLSTKGYVLC